jgi:site-specific DNA-methyltransferase (adenine-specific)
LDLLRQMPDNSVDSVVTDPPYGLSFMGKKWDYDVPATEVWVECLRVLKPGGHLLAFAGTRTQHRMAVRIEDAGFEIRDMIAWVYGSGFPKSRNLAGSHEGWGTALKPALEPITVARKPFPGTVAANVITHGTGALNIDACRISTGDDTARITNGAIRGGNFGAGGSSPGPVGGGHTDGRWPANLIHDGGAEVVVMFPAEAGAASRVKGTEASAASVGQITGQRDRVVGAFHGDSGSAARFFYCAKTSRADRHEGLDNPGPQFKQGTTLRKVETTDTKGNNHPTVKPTDLMAYLCRLITPAGGVVLDPFMGSGSTGKAAIREGFQFIGCEIDEQYAAIARSRIEHEITHQQEQQAESDQLDLFGTA